MSDGESRSVETQDGSAQTRLVFPVDPSALLAQQRDADRFVYSSYFQPLVLPSPPSQPDAALEKIRRPVGYFTDFDGAAARTVYGGADGHVYELLLRPGAPWSVGDLTALAGAPPAGGRPFGWSIELDGPTARVVYRGEDCHIHEVCSGPGMPWTHADLAARTGAPAAAGDPMGYSTKFDMQALRVVYRGTDNHIHELLCNLRTSWSHGDLTATTPNARLAAGDPMGYFTSFDGPAARVVYRGIDGHIHELWYRPGTSWSHGDLSALAGAPPAAGDPMGYFTDFDGPAARVVYRGIDGHIHELWYRPGTSWSHGDLSALAGAPPAAGDPMGYFTDFDGPAARVVYRGIDGHIHELWYRPGTSWSHGDLSALAGAPPAAGDPMGYRTDVVGPAACVVYRGLDGHIHELSYRPGASWSTDQLTPELPGQDEIPQLRDRLRSDVGYLFLDRTRITPRGFALGEHLYSMSLAPAEEVVIEQKTFSKRETTFEEQNEQEKQFDLELSSSLSTELTQGLERENSSNEQTAVQVAGSMTGQAQGTLGKVVTAGASVKFDASYARTLDEASRTTTTRSVKDSASSSRKVASKYRAVHKTTFRVSTETRFETSAKRVIRNPNQFSTLDINYFKILQRLILRQERYGVRLCWAPAVKAPAQALRTRIQAERQKITDRILNAVELPERPPERPVEAPTPRVECSVPFTVPDRVWRNGYPSDLSDEFNIAIPVPQGFVWDRDVEFVRGNTRVWATNIHRSWGWALDGTPWVADGQLWVRIHVGCDWAGLFTARGDIHVEAVARFIGDPEVLTEAYRKRYADWQIELDQWEAEVEQKLAEPRRRAEQEAAERENALVATLDPAAELVDRIIKTLPELETDEPWELEAWSQMFEWDRAAWLLYPGSWVRDSERDWTRPSADFLNASWAKVFVPVRPGLEHTALRWMIGRILTAPPSSDVEDAFERIENELSDFRLQAFGDQTETKLGADGTYEEHVIELGSWEEVLPTDGTHAEVIQGMSSAVDSRDEAELSDLAQLRAIVRSSEQQDVEVKKRVASGIGAKTPVNVTVAIASEEGTGNSANKT